MKVINIQNAKTHLSRLVEEAASGHDVVIAKAGRPIVRLVPFEEQKIPRKLGALAGGVKEAKDCWEPDAEIETLFYGAVESSSPHVAEEEES